MKVVTDDADILFLLQLVWRKNLQIYDYHNSLEKFAMSSCITFQGSHVCIAMYVIVKGKKGKEL